MKVNSQWLVVALIAAIVVLALRGPTLLETQAFNAGTSTTMGRIDDIEASRRITVVRYSYEVGGKTYKAEMNDRSRRLTGVPVQVTYATAKPWISTIQPGQIQSTYRTSLIVVAVGVLPFLIMAAMAIVAKFRRGDAAA